MIHSWQKYCKLIACIQLNAFHMLTEINCTLYHVISYLFLFHGSVQDYRIHMDMEIVIFAEEVKKLHHP